MSLQNQNFQYLDYLCNIHSQNHIISLILLIHLDILWIYIIFYYSNYPKMIYNIILKLSLLNKGKL